jgi:hypothetical protein
MTIVRGRTSIFRRRTWFFRGRTWIFRGRTSIFRGKNVHLPWKNVDLPWRNVDLPGKNVDLPGKNVDLPMEERRCSGEHRRCSDGSDQGAFALNVLATGNALCLRALDEEANARRLNYGKHVMVIISCQHVAGESVLRICDRFEVFGTGVGNREFSRRQLKREVYRHSNGERGITSIRDDPRFEYRSQFHATVTSGLTILVISGEAHRGGEGYHVGHILVMYTGSELSVAGQRVLARRR